VLRFVRSVDGFEKLSPPVRKGLLKGATPFEFGLEKTRLTLTKLASSSLDGLGPILMEIYFLMGPPLYRLNAFGAKKAARETDGESLLRGSDSLGVHNPEGLGRMSGRFWGLRV